MSTPDNDDHGGQPPRSDLGLNRLQSRSRPRHSRSTSASSVPYLPQGPEALIYPEGPISEEAVELLHECVHPGHRDKHKKDRAQTEDTLVWDDGEGAGPDEGLTEEEVDEELEDWEAMQKRPWYRRPSPLWCANCLLSSM